MEQNHLYLHGIKYYEITYRTKNKRVSDCLKKKNLIPFLDKIFCFKLSLKFDLSKLIALENPRSNSNDNPTKFKKHEKFPLVKN